MNVQCLSMLIAISLALSCLSSISDAVPITGGTGPGGIETTVGGAGTNLKLWLPAEGLQQSAGNVSQWLDASGNGYNATSPTTAPTYTSSGMNNLPSARYTGATTGGQVLTVSASAAGILQNVPGASLFVALDHSLATITTHQVYFAISTGDGSQNFRAGLRNLASNSQTLTVRGADADSPVNVSAAGTPITPLIAGGVIDYTPPNGQQDGFRYTNGTQVASNTNMAITGSPATANTPSDIILIGNILAGGQQLVGDLSEVIAFNRAVTQAERTIVDNYLSSKFNAGNIISGSDRGLATNDKYEGDTTTRGNYDFHVFGVGRAVTGASQVLSSGASGFGVDLTGNSLANDNWVFAGRSSLGNTNSIITTDLGTSGVDGRWQRDWFVDVTGTSFNATMAFDFVDADLPPEAISSTFSLLYRSGLVGDFTNLGITAQLAGDKILFQVGSAALLDGYYTLGINFHPAPEPGSLLLMLGVLGCGMLRCRRPVVNTIE